MGWEFNITDETGVLCTVLAKDDWKVQNLLDAVAAELDIPVDDQKLIYSGREMAPPRRDLKSYQMLRNQEGANLTLVRIQEKLSNDRRLALKSLREHRFEWASDREFKHLYEDREFTLMAVRQDKNALRQIADTFKVDKEIVLAAVQQFGCALAYVVDALSRDPDIVLAAVKQDGKVLEYAPDAFRADPGIVLFAVQKDAAAFQYASDRLKEDRDFVLRAVEQNTKVLEHTMVHFQRDPEIAVAAVWQGDFAPRYSAAQSESAQFLRQMAIEAVQQNGCALEHLMHAFPEDRELVYEAVKQNGRALLFATEAFRADRELALTAVQQNGFAMRYVADKFRGDREFMLEGLQLNGCAIEYFPEVFRTDLEIAQAAVKQDRMALQLFASPSDKFHHKVVLRILKADGLLLEVTPAFQDDHEVVLAAVEQNPRAIDFASERLQLEKEIVEAAGGIWHPPPKYMNIEELKGHWKRAGTNEPIGFISGETLFWHDGSEYHLCVEYMVQFAKNIIGLDFEGEHITANMVDGQLHWEDGDKWERSD